MREISTMLVRDRSTTCLTIQPVLYISTMLCIFPNIDDRFWYDRIFFFLPDSHLEMMKQSTEYNGFGKTVTGDNKKDGSRKSSMILSETDDPWTSTKSVVVMSTIICYDIEICHWSYMIHALLQSRLLWWPVEHRNCYNIEICRWSYMISIWSVNWQKALTIFRVHT